MTTAITLPRHLRLLALAVAFILSSFVATGLAAKADAAPYPPSSGCTISTVTASGQTGGSVSVTGSGFSAGATVDLTSNPGAVTLVSVQTDSDGSFDTTVTLPSGEQGIVAKSGSVTCSATQAGSDTNSSQRNNGNGTASGTGSGTASTGFQTLTASAIAGVLLLGGILFLVVGRRRANQR